MRVMARDRRVDEVIGNDPGLALIASRSKENALREIFKNLRWKQHAFSVPFVSDAVRRLLYRLMSKCQAHTVFEERRIALRQDAR